MNPKSKVLRVIGRATDICPFSVVSKRVFGRIFSFVFACALAFFPLLAQGVNKVDALSRPDDVLNYSDNVHSTFLANSNLKSTGKLSSIGKLPNNVAYNTFAPLLTDQTSMNGMIFTSADTNLIYGSLSNRYYDNTNDIDKGRYYYLLQESTVTGQYRVAAYQTNSLTFEFSKPSYVYLPKNSLRVDDGVKYYSDMLDDIQIWYGVQNAKFKLKGDDVNFIEIPTKCVVTMSISGFNALGDEVSYYYSTSTTDNFLFDNSIPYYQHTSANFNNVQFAFSDMLTTIMQYNNVYLINSLKLDIQLYQDNVKIEYLDLIGVENTYSFENKYENSCYGTIICQIPTYDENLTYTDSLYDNANKTWLTPHFEDSQTIFAFFGRFLDIEIMPNFKLSYLLTIAFGFVLITIFVRLFR